VLGLAELGSSFIVSSDSRFIVNSDSRFLLVAIDRFLVASPIYSDSCLHNQSFKAPAEAGAFFMLAQRGNLTELGEMLIFS
jgi:hypothetical protein